MLGEEFPGNNGEIEGEKTFKAATKNIRTKTMMKSQTNHGLMNFPISCWVNPAINKTKKSTINSKTTHGVTDWT